MHGHPGFALDQADSGTSTSTLLADPPSQNPQLAEDSEASDCYVEEVAKSSIEALNPESPWPVFLDTVGNIRHKGLAA